MKISLSGVPGSGKTDLANAIKDHFESNGETCTVIDGYVEELEKHANLALGFPAAYAGNIHIALERAAHERRLEEEYDHIVTCGTIFESASYVAQSLETDYSFVDSKEEKIDFIKRSEATMRIFGCFYIDLLKCDYLFHLSPLQISEDEKINILEQNLQSAFRAFNLIDENPLSADGVTNKDIVNNRLQEVIKVISEDNSKK